jgi:hypothetical protein
LGPASSGFPLEKITSFRVIAGETEPVNHAIPSRSIFSNALNFCRSAIAVLNMRGLDLSAEGSPLIEDCRFVPPLTHEDIEPRWTGYQIKCTRPQVFQAKSMIEQPVRALE